MTVITNIPPSGFKWNTESRGVMGGWGGVRETEREIGREEERKEIEEMCCHFFSPTPQSQQRFEARNRAGDEL